MNGLGVRVDTRDNSPNDDLRIVSSRPGLHRSDRGGRCDKTRHAATCDGARLLLCWTAPPLWYGHALFEVGTLRDFFDRRCPPVEAFIIEVAWAVIGMNACGMQDFGAEVVAQSSKASLVKHERGTLFSIDFLFAQVCL